VKKCPGGIAPNRLEVDGVYESSPKRVNCMQLHRIRLEVFLMCQFPRKFLREKSSVETDGTGSLPPALSRARQGISPRGSQGVRAMGEGYVQRGFTCAQ